METETTKKETSRKKEQNLAKHEMQMPKKVKHRSQTELSETNTNLHKTDRDWKHKLTGTSAKREAHGLWDYVGKKYPMLLAVTSPTMMMRRMGDLASNTKVQRLCLTRCEVDDDACAQLLKALQTNKTLRILTLD